MGPLFSIITPVYNGLAGLRRSFASVTAQAPGLCEYLVIDGASTDGAAEWLRQQDPALCRWISERDSGVYDAMNKGIATAQGRFLFFLGAGDELVPGVLARAAELIATLPAPQPLFIYGDVRVLNRTDRVLGGRFDRTRLCRENISHQAIFYERTIFALLGRYSLKYPVFADWAFNLRCFADDRIAPYYWPEVICDFEGNGLSDRIADMEFYRDRPAIIRQEFGLALSLRFQAYEQIQRFRHRMGRAAAKLRDAFHSSAP